MLSRLRTECITINSPTLLSYHPLSILLCTLHHQAQVEGHAGDETQKQILLQSTDGDYYMHEGDATPMHYSSTGLPLLCCEDSSLVDVRAEKLQIDQLLLLFDIVGI